MPQVPLSRSGATALSVAVVAAREAGALLRQRFATVKQVTEKGRGNIVTDVDALAEQMIMRRLRAEFPEYGILAEESGRSGAESESSWVIDPLDGTRNYASGVPCYAVNIALAQGRDILAGVTYDPTRDELFTAERGKGAHLNGAPLAVSPCATLRAALMGTDMGYSDQMGSYVLQLLERLWPEMQGGRVMGSAALGLAYAAAGRLDIYFHHLLSPWDMASGVLLGQEAGAVVTNRTGEAIDFRKDPSIILANPTLQGLFLQRTSGLSWRERGT